ncbi:MAG TPA: tripartite tricarboxylate transporter substrate binding protein [Ramlibacter sp.]|nr:tripartite tricarboxylate transporter substrate binding protein [Ramlibacter sp.]
MKSNPILRALAFVAAMAGLAPAHSQTFPDKPVRIVLGFPAGGGSDTPTRIIAPKLAEVLGQQVIVENRTGAGGYVGAQAVARSPADGYTLYGCTIATHGIGPGLYKKPPVDAEKDFSFVGMIGANPNILMVHPSVPAKTLPEFVAWVKSQGGKLSYAAPSVGGSPHLAMELLKQMTGMQMTGIAYRGDAPARQDVIAGHVPALFGAIGPSLTAIRGGLVRPIAVSSPKRDPALPDVPTVAEFHPGFSVVSWLGLCAPAGTPAPALDRLNAALVKVVGMPDVSEQLAKVSLQPDPMSRQDFEKFVKAEIVRWRKLTHEAGIAAELTN